MRRTVLTSLFLLLLTGTLAADGLLVSSTKNYPSTLLRNRLTRVSVNISGVVAETVVYQEFVNEWSETTDAVWVFPLPADARATAFYYWRHDTLFQAVLRVQEQVITPGTGEGDVPAAINSYIGKNGIKIELKGIEPWAIQRVELHYISVCDFWHGEGVYRYPLASSTFLRYPLELLEFRLSLNAGAAVTDYTFSCEGDIDETRAAADRLTLVARKSKAYVTSDVEFTWRAESDTLAVDFFSCKSDTTDGYYAMMIRPPDRPQPRDIIRRRVVFCLEQSSRMYGVALDQTRTAIDEALTQLTEEDEFNVLAFESQVKTVFDSTVKATPDNVQLARAFLAGLKATGGSRLDLALARALPMFATDGLQNILVTLAVGRSTVTPESVALLNTADATMIMFGLGGDVDRSRMELIAERNGGFARFLDFGTAMAPEISRVFRSLNQLLMRNVQLEYPEVNVYGVRPDPAGPMYAGMPLLTAGRYRKPGASTMSLAGEGADGPRAYTFRLDFVDSDEGGTIAHKLWAKLMIDGMERQIDVYGQRATLKDSLIAVSLASGLRCRYTAYIADYVNVVSDVEAPDRFIAAPMDATCIVDNYPNPFNPSTNIRIRILADRLPGSDLHLAVYDMLGRLVRVIDLSRYPVGTHVIEFDGRDMHGRSLPSGTYTLVLLSASRSYGSRSIVMMR